MSYYDIILKCGENEQFPRLYEEMKKELIENWFIYFVGNDITPYEFYVKLADFTHSELKIEGNTITFTYIGI